MHSFSFIIDWKNTLVKKNTANILFRKSDWYSNFTTVQIRSTFIPNYTKWKTNFLFYRTWDFTSQHKFTRKKYHRLISSIKILTFLINITIRKCLYDYLSLLHLTIDPLVTLFVIYLFIKGFRKSSWNNLFCFIVFLIVKFKIICLQYVNIVINTWINIQ